MANKKSWTADRDWVIKELDNHGKKLDKIIDAMGGLKAKVAIGSATIAGIVSWLATHWK